MLTAIADILPSSQKKYHETISAIAKSAGFTIVGVLNSFTEEQQQAIKADLATIWDKFTKHINIKKGE